MTVVENKKYQVGDKVISTKDTPNIPEGFIGYIVERERLVGDNYEYTVEGKNGESEFFNEYELQLLGRTREVAKPDAVNHPKHYAVFEQLEAIEVIASSMTTEQFYGYCLGNILKYRLRAGGKDDVMQELGKADKYQELFSKFKPLCQDYV